MTQPFNPPSAHRVTVVAVAAALATFAGLASAQAFKNTGNPVRSTYSDCVRSGQQPEASCPPAARADAARVAQADSPRRATGPSAASAAAASPAAAGASSTDNAPPVRLPGYATASDGRVVLSGFGHCVRAGHWTAANAAEPCDLVARADVPPPPVAAAPAPAPAVQPAPAPEPAPQPIAQAEPPRPVIQKLTLSTDVLFDFDKAELKESGKQRLDQLADQIKDADVDEIIAVGHADRIASEGYNQKLSEQRAQAVKEYLASRGAKANAITAQGKGESQPVTGSDCQKMGPESGSNKKLVACLAPDRRVEIEVLGSRQVAGTPPAGAGSTGGTGSTGGAGSTSR